MKYRALTSTGDYRIGYGQAGFYINKPEAVAQAVLTRLKLYKGEWFLDTTDGTDWYGSVLGNNTRSVRDAILRARILDTPGVKSILAYSSNFDGSTRRFSVSVAIDTIYGTFPTQRAPQSQGGTVGTGLPPPNGGGGGGGSVQVFHFILDDPVLGILDNPKDVLG